MNNTLLYAATVLIWGSTWLVINYQLGQVAPVISLVYRFALAAGLLMGFCWWTGRQLRFGPGSHLSFFGMGLFMFGLNYLGAYWAQFYIPSALNALVFATIVWLNILFTRLLFGVRSSGLVYLGALAGTAGIVIVLWPQVESLSLSDETVIGAIISFSGALSASVGNMVSQRAQSRQLPVISSNAWGMCYGTGLYLLWALVSGSEWQFDPSFQYVTSLMYLALFGTVIGFGCYLTLLGRIGAHKAGYANVMFPVVAVVLSVLFEGLEVNLNLLLGMALVLAGNFAILQRS